ncbi:MAG: hypothetical protein WBD16_12090 [Pyrinomonadaceae bacterium]
MPESTYKNYFLGSLAEEPSAEIELRVVENADFAAEIASAEENLIEDFLDGRLSAEDVHLFRNNYLVTEERIKNVEMTALMRRLAGENANNSVEIDDSNSREDAGFFRWFGSLGMGVRLAAAFVGLIVVMTSIWFVLRPQRDTELIALQHRYEQINQNPGSLDLNTKLSELTLVSDTLRSAGSKPELPGTDLTENIRFRIALPPQTDSSLTYNVTIFRDAAEVFRQNNIRPLVNPSGPELRLLLPREIFASGNYSLNLKSGNAPDLNYLFVIK